MPFTAVSLTGCTPAPTLFAAPAGDGALEDQLAGRLGISPDADPSGVQGSWCMGWLEVETLPTAP